MSDGLTEEQELEVEIAKAKAVAVRKRKQAEAAAAPQQQAPASEQPAAQSPSQGTAALLGFGRGASFGALPALEGGMKAAQAAILKAGAPLARPVARVMAPGMSDADVDAVVRDAAREVLGIDLGDSVAQTYAGARDAKRGDLDAAAKAWPKTTLASTVAGGMAVPLPGSQALQGAGWATKAAIRGAQGTGAGALNAFNESRANLIGPSGTNADGSAPSLVGDTVKGGVIGGVAAPVLGGVFDKAGREAGGWLKRNAEEMALKAMGLRAGISSQLQKMGYGTADDARELGRAALEMGVIPKIGTAADVAKSAAEKQKLYGALIEGSLKDADAAAASQGSSFDWNAGAAAAAKGMGDLSATARREATRAQQLVQDILAEGSARSGPQTQAAAAKGMGGFEAANKLKSDMYKGINYGTSADLATELERKAASGLRQSIEEQVGMTAGADVAEALRTGNQGYGTADDIAKLAAEEARRALERQTPLTKLATSTLPAALAIGGAAGGVPGIGVGSALGAYALNKAAPYLPGLSANVSNALQTPVPKAVSGLGSLLSTATRQRAAQSIDQQEEDAVARFLRSGQ